MFLMILSGPLPSSPPPPPPPPSWTCRVGREREGGDKRTRTRGEQWGENWESYHSGRKIWWATEFLLIHLTLSGATNMGRMGSM